MLVDQAGKPKGELKIGEQKSIQTDRVVLVPGPREELEVVRWMYEQFVKERKSESQIAELLNQRGVLTDFGRRWCGATVHQVLTNEKYVGNNVYHRTSFKLKRKHVVNPPEKWIRADGAFQGVVPRGLFYDAREIILARSQNLSDEALLERLRSLLSANGELSAAIIDAQEGGASSSGYRHRFGSLIKAYSLAEFHPCSITLDRAH